MERKIITNSLIETQKVAEEFAKTIKDKNHIIVLSGNLGCGKTSFVQGFAKGLSIKDYYINSPSYNIINEYEGDKKLYHMDFYRLNSIDDLENLGFFELIEEEGIFAIEWGDKFGLELFKFNTLINFRTIERDSREINIKKN